MSDLPKEAFKAYLEDKYRGRPWTTFYQKELISWIAGNVDLSPYMDDLDADPDIEKGCKLWNDGSTWKQVTSELYGDEFDESLVNATRAAIKRYAKAHKIKLRPGGKGGAPKKRPAK